MRSVLIGFLVSIALTSNAAGPTTTKQKAQPKPTDPYATAPAKSARPQARPASAYPPVIEETLVPVSGKTMNISVNPLGLVLGSANIQFDYKLAQSFTLGGRLSYAKYSSSTVTATSTGLGAVGIYYFKGALLDGFRGLFGFDYISATGNGASISGTSFSLLGGYGWFWPGGFNMSLEGGIRQINLNFSGLGLGSYSGSGAALAFNLGYAF